MGVHDAEQVAHQVAVGSKADLEADSHPGAHSHPEEGSLLPAEEGSLQAADRGYQYKCRTIERLD